MKLRKNLIVLTVVLLPFLLASCKFKDLIDNTPPPPPTNVFTITGDNRVDIYWDEDPAPDLEGYNIYVSDSYDGSYTLIGSTTNTFYIDNQAVNGVTYYYAVTAFDVYGNESDLSKDIVHDTPRPEGFDRVVFDVNNFPEKSGYSFGINRVVAYDDSLTDFFYENASDSAFYIDVWSDTEIQDMGATFDIYDVDKAPVDGWVPLLPGDNIKYVPAIEGHTYVIWTYDDHYAKIRISSLSPSRIIFDWAYQLDAGNPELKRSNRSGKRMIYGHIEVKR